MAMTSISKEERPASEWAKIPSSDLQTISTTSITKLSEYTKKFDAKSIKILRIKSGN